MAQDTQLFLVRVWQHLAQFRASVRGVDEEEPHLFTEPAQVTEFLVHTLVSPASPEANQGDIHEHRG
jgi:hypothetical protein